MTLADQLRDFVERRFLAGSPRGYNILHLADQIEAIEQGDPQLEASPSTVTAPENAEP